MSLAIPDIGDRLVYHHCILFFAHDMTRRPVELDDYTEGRFPREIEGWRLWLGSLSPGNLQRRRDWMVAEVFSRRRLWYLGRHL